jgi:hypothetical protein
MRHEAVCAWDWRVKLASRACNLLTDVRRAMMRFMDVSEFVPICIEVAEQVRDTREPVTVTENGEPKVMVLPLRWRYVDPD